MKKMSPSGALLARRSDHLPELQPSVVYGILAALHAGDAIPCAVYVADYADGQIPRWQVHTHTRDARSGVVCIIAFDTSNTYTANGKAIRDDGLAQASLFGNDATRYPAVRIFSSRAKTLRSPVVEYTSDEGWPSYMCDMLQQAKINTRCYKQPQEVSA